MLDLNTDLYTPLHKKVLEKCHSNCENASRENNAEDKKGNNNCSLVEDICLNAVEIERYVAEEDIKIGW